jgi:hypothetical protein
MGSVAVNGQGDMALGYSISSTSVYPSIRVTGRLAGDALGQMTQGETTIINGSGWQGHSSGRWGDYSMMSVDPVDDCTFWYTQEYYTSQVAGNAAWQTRVGAFQLRDCGGSPVDNPPSVAVTSPAEGATVSGSMSVTASASDDHGVTQVQFFVDSTSLGIDTNGADGWSATWNSTGVADGAHTIRATATDTIGQTASDTNNVTVDNVPDPTPTLHIGDLDGSKSVKPRQWNVTVTITVHNASHQPVSGVSVTGSWSNGGTSSCTTNSSGVCSVSKTKIPSSTTAITFTVTNASASGYSYTSSANHDVDGGSNGTSITINR